MILIRLFILSVFFICNVSYANPAPLGLEIGKATVEDVKKKYKIVEIAPNINDGYYIYYLDTKDMPFESVSKSLVVCDNAGVVQSAYLEMDHNQFDNIVQILSGKYQIEEKQIFSAEVGHVYFAEGSSRIRLFKGALGTTLGYESAKFAKDTDARAAAEKAAKQAKVKSML